MYSIVYGYPQFRFFSCNPENLAEDEVELQACCGNGEDIPPPPPPPPGK